MSQERLTHLLFISTSRRIVYELWWDNDYDKRILHNITLHKEIVGLIMEEKSIVFVLRVGSTCEEKCQALVAKFAHMVAHF